MINTKEPEMKPQFVIKASLQEAIYCNFGSSAPQYWSQESTRKTQILRDAGKILKTDIKYFILKNVRSNHADSRKRTESSISIEFWQQHRTVVCYRLEHRAAAFVAELDKEQNRHQTKQERKIFQAPCFTSFFPLKTYNKAPSSLNYFIENREQIKSTNMLRDKKCVA